MRPEPSPRTWGMHPPQSVANVLYALATELTSRLVSAALLLIVTRGLGPSSTGIYTLGTTLLFIGSRISLWGLDQILMRNLATRPTEASRYFATFGTLRLLLSIFMALMLTGAILWLRPLGPQATLPLVLVAIGLLPENIAEICRSILYGLEKAQYAAAAGVLTGVAKVVGALAALLAGLGLTGVAAALTLANGLGALAAIALLWKGAGLQPERPQTSSWLPYLKEGLPFWAIGLATVADAQTDIIVLSALVSPSELGLYGSALGILLALTVLPNAYRLGFFPRIVQAYERGTEEVRRVYSFSFKYLVTLALPVGLGIVLTSEPLVRFLFGEGFVGAAAPLRILAVCMLVLLPGDVNSRLLIASRNQVRAAQFTVLGLAVNLGLALALVPRLGIEGAAWARLASNVMVFGLGHVFVQRRIARVRVGPLVWRPLLAGLGMAWAVFQARASLWPSVFLGIAIYAVLIVALGGVSFGEVKRVLGLHPREPENNP